MSQDSPFGSASLNLTNIRESDQGWYECKVVFLNRDPKQHKNGTWFHLDVHAPPRFSVTPEDIIYVNLGESNRAHALAILPLPLTNRVPINNQERATAHIRAWAWAEGVSQHLTD